MSRTWARYIAVLYLGHFLSVLGAVVVVFLVADFGDRLKLLVNHGLGDVLELYVSKALVAVQQLGPAAMLLGAGAAVSTLRRRGEYTAIRALGGSRRHVYVPVAVVSLGLALGLSAWDELVAGPAGARVDAILFHRFGTWGDWRFFHVPRQWFRVQDHIFRVRGEAGPASLADVTVLRLDARFRLAERVDVERMVHLEGDTWELHGARARRFDAQGQAEEVFQGPTRRAFPGVGRDTFGVMLGKPEQMSLALLQAQRVVRERVGLSTERLDLALHNRFAYPLTGLMAALAAVALAARPSRRGHLTVALVEGLGVAGALWVLMLLARSAVLADRLPAWAAAWLPPLGLGLLALALGRWVERLAAARPAQPHGSAR